MSTLVKSQNKVVSECKCFTYRTLCVNNVPCLMTDGNIHCFMLQWLYNKKNKPINNICVILSHQGIVHVTSIIVNVWFIKTVNFKEKECSIEVFQKSPVTRLFCHQNQSTKSCYIWNRILACNRAWNWQTFYIVSKIVIQQSIFPTQLWSHFSSMFNVSHFTHRRKIITLIKSQNKVVAECKCFTYRTLCVHYVCIMYTILHYRWVHIISC